MSVFCEECGTSLEDDVRFCHNCGSAAPDTAAIEPSIQATPVEPSNATAVSSNVSAPLVATPQPTAADAPSSKDDLAAAGLGVINQWGIVGIRYVSDRTWGDKEGMLLPVPLETHDTIRLEKRDGSTRSFNCIAISVRVPNQKNPLMRVSKIRGQVLLTDSRITIACSKYEKGGGWWGLGGGALLAIPLNVGSHALAAMRRRGKMLVGQVRYPWIEGVYGQNKDGYKGAEMLRIIVNLGGKKRAHLQLTLPNNVDAVAVAAELTRRAAQFRLAHDPDPMGNEERAKFEELANLKPLVYQKGSGKMAGQQFPTSWGVGGRSAGFGLTLRASESSSSVAPGAASSGTMVVCSCGADNRPNRTSCWSCSKELATA